MTDDYDYWDQYRSSLLQGVCDDLLDTANRALDAYNYVAGPDALRPFGIWGPEYNGYDQYGELKLQIVDVFKTFSEPDIQGIQQLVDNLDETWTAFDRDSKEDLDGAQRLLGSWYGDAAEATTMYLAKLEEAFDTSVTNISQVEAGAVAARDLIASARGDLEKLTESFFQAAKQYHDAHDAQDEGVFGRLLMETFVTALLGYLTAGAATIGTVTIARGAVAAAEGAGTYINGMVSEGSTGSVSGGDPIAIINSFLDGANQLARSTSDSAEQLAHEIHNYSNNLAEIPAPPDVSPGSSFDPENFRTDSLPGELEKAVLHTGTDIRVDGDNVTVDSAGTEAAPSQQSAIAARLAGEPEEGEPADTGSNRR